MSYPRINPSETDELPKNKPNLKLMSYPKINPSETDELSKDKPISN